MLRVLVDSVMRRLPRRCARRDEPHTTPIRRVRPRWLDCTELEERTLFSATPLAVVPMQSPDPATTNAATIACSLATAGASQSTQANAESSVAFASAALTTEVAQRHELVFVDTGVEDYQSLVNDLLATQDKSRQTDVVLLDASRDGIEQITEVLASYHDLDAIHFISHGEDGAVELGNTWLNNSNVAAYASQIAGWSHALSTQGDLLFYGCDLAADAIGQQFLQQIHNLTGADVAASTDITGAAALGGNWILEDSIGTIDTTVVISAAEQASWQHLLSATPVGSEFRVNTTTQNAQQTFPQTPEAVAMNPTTGDYVVVWSSKHQFSSDTWDVFMQRYNAAGVALGGETLVNTHVNNVNQQYATAAMNSSGNFVVTWSSDQGGHSNVYAQQFNANGVAQGTAILVDTPASKDQLDSTVAINSSGNFVVTWSGQQSGNWDIYANVFNTNGVSQTGPMQITNLGKDQQDSTVAMSDAGNYVIAWSGHQLAHWNIYAEMFGSNNQPVGTAFQVNTNTTTDQQYAAVALDASSNFTVTWSGHQSGHWDVYAQSYLSSGVTNGNNFQVNTASQDDQEYSSVAFAGSANPIITWSSKNQDGNGWGIYVQQMTPTGTMLGSEVQANTYTHDDQVNSSIAGATNGNVAIVWTSNKQDGNNFGVYGQLFAATTSNARIVVGNNNLQTSETGTSAIFGISLATAPTANVTVSFGVSDPTQGTLSTSVVTFTPGNWNVVRNITVTGLDDHIVHGDQIYQITGTASSSDANYSNLSMTPVSVTNTEADAVGYTVAPAGLTTSETGTSASFTVALTSKPLAAVTLNLGTSVAGEGSLSQSSLTFDVTNWSAAQTVTVTGLDDHIVHGNQTYQVTGSATSSDANYNNLAMTPVSVTNTEADTAGFTVTPSSIQTSMSGASANFSVALTSQPSAPVTITLNSSNPAEGNLSQPSLTFDATNWNTPQTIIVTGQNDPFAGGNVSYQITGTAASTDTNYGGLGMQAVNVTNVSTSSPGFIVTPTSLTTSETGTSATFSVVLATLPVLPVTVDLTGGNPNEGTLSQTSLSFSLLSWNVPQTVTVTGLDDHIVDGNQTYQITGAANTLDLGYAGLSMAPVTVTNTEADIAAVSVTTNALSTSETGTSAAFGVMLTSQPNAPVTVNLGMSVAAQGSLSQSSLIFDASNWNVAQSVTVTGLDDHIVHGNQIYQITGTAASTDVNFNNVTMTPVTVTNTEADSAGVAIAPLALTTSETGTSSSFTVALTSQPLAPVTLNLQMTTAGEGTLSQSTFNFDASNWSTPQTVTVTGVDDHIVHGNQIYQITGSTTSADANYAGQSAPAVTVTNTEADSAGFIVTPNALTTSETGTTAAFDVKLTSQPLANVVINLSVTDTSQGSLSQSVLTFNAGNWNVAQTVTVTGLDDHINHGNQSYQVTGSVTSSDSHYQALSMPAVSVVNQEADFFPVATDKSFSLDNDTTLSVTGAGVLVGNTDPYGRPLTAVLVNGPAHGTLTLNANGSFIYTPFSLYSGPDSFTYKANDGSVDSNVATVSLQVNTAPVFPAPPTPTVPQTTVTTTTTPAVVAVAPILVVQGVPAPKVVVPPQVAMPRGAFDHRPSRMPTSVQAPMIMVRNESSEAIQTAARMEMIASQRIAVVARSIAPNIDQLWFETNTLADLFRADERPEPLTLALTSVTAALSAGYVLWCMHAGTLTASLLAALPAWKSFDPVPVLEFWSKKSKEAGDDELAADENEEHLDFSPAITSV